MPRAMIGVPTKRARSAPRPVHLAMAAIEPSAIARIGTTMGANASAVLGSLP